MRTRVKHTRFAFCWRNLVHRHPRTQQHLQRHSSLVMVHAMEVWRVPAHLIGPLYDWFTCKVAVNYRCTFGWAIDFSISFTALNQILSVRMPSRKVRARSSSEPPRRPYACPRSYPKTLDELFGATLARLNLCWFACVQWAEGKATLGPERRGKSFILIF